jgi:hypothetical protein
MTKKILFVSFSALFTALLLLAPSHSHAADPQLLVTWKGTSLAPYDFSGRLMPSANSLITASAQALLGNGTVANLTNEIIYWYANDQLIGGGKGVQTVTFQAPSIPGGLVTLRAQLPNFNDTFTAKTITIPIANPQAIIEVPFAGSAFSKSPVTLKAHAFYFSASGANNLVYAWTVNGVPPESSDDPEILNINIDPKTPSGVTIGVNLTVNNPDLLYEGTQTSIALTYQP